ncbi:MAG: ice-binding family protein [Actinomycetes bacterium]
MKHKRLISISTATFLAATTIGFVTSLPSQAATSPTLGASANYALLSSNGLANAGATTIQGDVGMSPTISYTDTGSLTLSSGIRFNDANTAAAIAAANSAYASAAAAAPATAITTDLGALTLVPGTYAASAGLNLNGTLTLDGQNNSSSVFILQTPATLTTGAASRVTLINGAQACNVFWQSGSNAALGANSDFKGTILSNANISLGSATTVSGRLIALHGTISLNANKIAKPNCSAPIPVPSKQSSISGGGTYMAPSGRATFSLSIKSSTQAGVVNPVVSGKIAWQVKKGWKFQGSLTTLSTTNAISTSTGSGSLWYWSSTNKGHDGRWVLATTGNALTSVQFTMPTASTKGHSRPISSFAIGFSGVLATGSPSLPVIGNLLPVSGGNDD